MYLKKLKEKLSKKKKGKKVKKKQSELVGGMTDAQWNAYSLKRMKEGSLSTSPSDTTKKK